MRSPVRVKKNRIPGVLVDPVNLRKVVVVVVEAAKTVGLERSRPNVKTIVVRDKDIQISRRQRAADRR